MPIQFSVGETSARSLDGFVAKTGPFNRDDRSKPISFEPHRRAADPWLREWTLDGGIPFPGLSVRPRGVHHHRQSGGQTHLMGPDSLTAQLLASHGETPLALASLLQVTDHAVRQHLPDSEPRLQPLLRLQRACVDHWASSQGVAPEQIDRAVVDLQRIAHRRVGRCPQATVCPVVTRFGPSACPSPTFNTCPVARADH